MDLRISLDEARLIEQVVFAQEFLDSSTCHNAGILLSKALWVGVFEDADIAAQALEYDTVKKGCEGPTDLERFEWSAKHTRGNNPQ